MLTHVGSDISIERDSILLTCLTSTSAVSGEGMNGDPMPTILSSAQGGENRFLAREESSRVVETTFLDEDPKRSSCGWFLKQM